MRDLYFTRPVLYLDRQYQPGDKAPQDAEMLEEWKISGSVTEQNPKKDAPKAELMTAEPGRPAKASSGDPDALLGKPPKRGRK